MTMRMVAMMAVLFTLTACSQNQKGGAGPAAVCDPNADPLSWCHCPCGFASDSHCIGGKAICLCPPCLDMSATAERADAALDLASPADLPAPSDLTAVGDLAQHGSPSDGGTVCGKLICNPHQVCVWPCDPPLGCDMSASMGGRCTALFCVDIAKACGDNPTCGCFPLEPCGKFGGVCSDIVAGLVVCGQCGI